jgi:hypothetical protein
MSNYTLGGGSAKSAPSITEEEDTWTAEVLYDHVADTKAELSVSAGDIITVFEPDGNNLIIQLINYYFFFNKIFLSNYNFKLL